MDPRDRLKDWAVAVRALRPGPDAGPSLVGSILVRPKTGGRLRGSTPGVPRKIHPRLSCRPASGDSNARTRDSRSFSHRMVGAMSTLWGGRRGAIRAELAGLVTKRWKTRAMLRVRRLWCARVSSPPVWRPSNPVNSGASPGAVPDGMVSTRQGSLGRCPRSTALAVQRGNFGEPTGYGRGHRSYDLQSSGARGIIPVARTRHARLAIPRPRWSWSRMPTTAPGLPRFSFPAPQPWGGRGHPRGRDRLVLDFSQCPTAAPPQHPKTPGLSREPLSGQ